MSNRKELPIEYLYECFCPKFMEGKLCWNVRPREHFNTDHGMILFNAKYATKEAGSTVAPSNRRTAYRIVLIDGGKYYLHRVLYAMFYGFWPEQADHIDGDGLNNCISNLRSCNQKENSRNLPIQKNNSSGRVGVHWDKNTGKWRAQISADGKRLRLGSHSTFESAVAAREKAEKQYGYHANHGREQ